MNLRHDLAGRRRKIVTIEPAQKAGQIAAARQLFREYAEALAVDLCFQDFEAELRDLPGRYSPPRGIILLAAGPDDEMAGCAAVRPIDAEVCEMKRLFVRPPFRRWGLGRRLAEATLAFARNARYHTMRLDTLRRLGPALELYRDLGFREAAPYYENPIDDVVYMELEL
jgi:GNAT superfamily N-acetyltransferase